MNFKLGVLDPLPSELRTRIFRMCIENRSIGLLRTNKMLYKELLPQLREDFVLNLRIDAGLDVSRILIMNENGTKWGQNNNEILVEGFHLQPAHNPLNFMPICEFKELVVNIQAPYVDDPGQVIGSYKLTSALITLLSPSWRRANHLPTSLDDIVYTGPRKYQKLPPIRIVLREAERREWCEYGEWSNSLPSSDVGWYKDISELTFNRATWSDESEDKDKDVEIVLLPFMRLRNVTSLLVVMPARYPKDKVVDEMFDDLKLLTEDKVPFGLECGEPYVSDDADILEQESVMYLWLDYLLDITPGPTAAKLRFKRFQTWCPRYEHHLDLCFRGLKSNKSKQKIVGSACDSKIWSKAQCKIVRQSYHSRFWAWQEWKKFQYHGEYYQNHPELQMRHPHTKLIWEKDSNSYWSEFVEKPASTFESSDAMHTLCTRCATEVVNASIGSRCPSGPTKLYLSTSA